MTSVGGRGVTVMASVGGRGFIIMTSVRGMVGEGEGVSIN